MSKQFCSEASYFLSGHLKAKCYCCVANGHISCYGLVCGPHVESNGKWYTLLPRLLCTFIVYTEHMNVATGYVIHPGRPCATNGSWVLDHLPTPCTEAVNF